MSQLIEISEVNIQPLAARDKNTNNSIKLVGGYGISKEAAKLTLLKILEQPLKKHQRINNIYTKYFEQLENEAYSLGKQATEQLELQNIHPEIQKLVGALNWRTSYRQNQYHHTLEVATLAGLLAHELGVDPQDATRSGLLHDIGKVPDENPELPHAILGMKWAEKYGENEDVCNAIGAHHDEIEMNNLISPIVQVCDAVSGARPGARREVIEAYLNRLKELEELALSEIGVMKA